MAEDGIRRTGKPSVSSYLERPLRTLAQAEFDRSSGRNLDMGALEHRQHTNPPPALARPTAWLGSSSPASAVLRANKK